MTTFKEDSDRHSHVDYTEGKSFYEFEIKNSRKLTFHIIFHVLHTYMFIRVFSNLDQFTFFGPDIINSVIACFGVGLIIIVPIFYWFMIYRTYKKLQKGISL